MEKTTNLKTRALALLLTVLMIVGVLPMTVFALQPAENSTPTYDYKKPDAEEIVEGLWNSDSKYWTLAITSSNAGYMPSYSTSAGAGRNWNGAYVSNDTVVMTATAGSRYVIGHTLAVSYNASEYQKIFRQNTSGIDFAYSLDFKIDASMADSTEEGVFMFGPAFVASEGARYDTLRVKVSGTGADRKYELYWPNGYADDFATALGAKICDLEVGKSYNIKAVYDVGNSASKARTYFVWIDGEYVGAGNANLGASLSYCTDINSGDSRQIGWNTADGTSYEVGPMLFGFDFESKGAIAWSASNFDLYLYDDTPDDNNVHNSTRGAKFLYYNDFDNLAVDTQYKSTAADATKLAGTIAGLQMSNGSESKNYLAAFEGKDGLAVRSSYSGGDAYVDFWPGTAWATMSVFSGRSFVYSADVYGADSYPQRGALFSFGDRDGTNFHPVLRDKDGSLYLGYFDGAVCTDFSTNGDNLTAAQKSGGFLAKLDKDNPINVTVQVNVKENYFVVYIDGVDMTGKLNLFTDAKKAEILAKTNDDSSAKYPNGFAWANVRMNYTSAMPEYSLAYDNITAYFADEVIFNYIPVKPALKYPDGAKLQEELAKIGGSLAVYNDFDSATSGTDYKTGAMGATHQFNDHIGNSRIVDDGTGNKAMLYRFNTSSRYKHNVPVHLQANGNSKPLAANSGKSFVWSADFKIANGLIAAGTLATFTSYLVSSGISVDPLKVDADGSVYYYELGTKKAKVATLTTNEYLNLALQFDIPNNVYSVYVNGELAVSNVKFLTDAQITTITSTEGFENGFAISSIGCYREVGDAAYNGLEHMYLDNYTVYYADRYIAPEQTIEDDAYNGGVNSFNPPDSDDVTATLGDSALIYYNDFNSGTVNNSGIGNASFTRSNAWQFVDDGNGGKAAQTKNANQQNTMITIGKSHGAQVTTYAGKSFTFSGDFKLGDATNPGALFYFMSTVTGSKAHNFVAMPVWLDADGNIYNGQVTTAKTGNISKKSITSGIFYYSNDFGAESTELCTADRKIGTLSKDKFTNVAVSVDVPNNVYSIYVDGVCVAKNQTFACQTMLDYYAACDAENGTLEFANGFGLSGICLGYRNKVTGNSYIFDNWLAYTGTKLVGLTSDYDGYVAEGGGMYYYEDGEIVGNKVSADGLFTIDAYGQVFYGSTPVKSLNDYYTYVNGELVPKDGVYSGLYQGNMFIGKADGNLYYYNVEKKMVKDAPVYDIKDDNAALDGVVGYVIGADGIITDTLDGLVELADGTRYYVDGARKTGLFTVDTKTYFAGEDDYLASGLVDVGNGVYYFFDEATFEGTIRNGIVTELDGNTYYYKADGTRYTGWFEVSGDQYAADANGVLQTGEQLDAENNPWVFDETTFVGVRDGLTIFNAGTADEYAVLYIMGVLQTEDSIESFATNNPFYYNGFYYYIELDDGVDGQTNLFFDDSGTTKIIDSTVYSFDGYKAIKVADCVIDGKYYDENGVLVKDEFFEGLDRNGETVWYHADTNTGDLLTGYAFDDTVWYYFADVTEEEPYVGALLNGIHKYDFDDDATTEDTYRYFENGVAFVGGSKDVDDYTVIVKNNEGDLYVANATDPKEFVGGKWYVANDANAPYALTFADGVYNSVFVGNTEATYRFFQNGVLFTDGAYEIESGVWYAANVNGDLYVNESATEPKLIAGMWVVNAGGAPYRGAFADGVYYSVYEGNTEATYRFFQNGVLFTDGAYEIESGVWYAANVNGDLYVNESATEPKLIEGMWVVNAGGAPYRGAFADGVYYSVYEGNTEETYRYFENGVLVTVKVNTTNGYYLPDAEGDLYVTSTTAPIEYEGKWYVASADEYTVIYADGIIADVLYATGDVVEGDAEGVIYAHTLNDGSYTFGAASTAALEVLAGDKDYTFIYKYVNGKLVKDTESVTANGDRAYDFGVDYVGTLRDNYYESADEYVWVDGYLVTDGIHFVSGVEMYFEDGKASAGNVMTEDGTVHDFGPDGLRIPSDGGEVVDKAPYSVKVTVMFKDGDTVTRLAYREFYRLYNTSYTFVPGWYQCYGYTVTVNGVEVTAADGEVLKAVIEATDTTDTEIVVIYDSSIDAHSFVLKADECVAATCCEGGKNVYVCTACTRGGRYEEDTDINPDNHSLTTSTTPATHSTVGVSVTTCSNGCDYSVTEYLPMVAHTWVEVDGSRVDATCGANGEVKYTCTCGAEKTETLYATGKHNYAPFASTEATCAQYGSVSYMCTDCEAEYVVQIPCTHEHVANQSTGVQIPDTDSEYDTFVYDCSVCGKAAIINVRVPAPDDEDDDENP